MKTEKQIIMEYLKNNNSLRTGYVTKIEKYGTRTIATPDYVNYYLIELPEMNLMITSDGKYLTSLSGLAIGINDDLTLESNFYTAIRNHLLKFIKPAILKQELSKELPINVELKKEKRSKI